MNELIQKIPLDLLDDPQLAMRTETDDESINELMADMKAVGLIQPITVRRGNVDGVPYHQWRAENPKLDIQYSYVRYEVIAGHRRTRAARLLNWAIIDAKVVEASDEEALTMRIIENISRKDVDPVDEACYIGEIMQKYKKDIDEMAMLMRRSRQWVETRLAVFNMPPYLQEHLKYKKISLGVALALNKIIDEKDKRYYSDYAATQGAGIAAANRWVLELNNRENITDEIRQNIIIAGQQTEYNRKRVACARCDKPLFLDEADMVWVHRFNCLNFNPDPS